MKATIEGLPTLRGQLLQDAPLSAYTSWRIGGPADYLYQPADVADLALFLQHLPLHFPVTWLGLGSNTLVRDGGIAGVVIITQGALNQLKWLDDHTLYAEAGVASAQLARLAARQGADNLAFMAGIPGTVGGALAMNAGCFGGETWQSVLSVDTLDRRGQRQTRLPKDFQVSYRRVAGLQEAWFVAARFSGVRGDKEKALEDIRCLLERRHQTQPTGLLNCGSVFRNPPQHYAGALIEQCGLKGYRCGGAVVSEKHANFIINDQDAKASDIETLIEHVRHRVYQDTGIALTPEVHIIGRTSSSR
jgi:UDP-N-acetylmuramate dehydrogenase